MKLLLQLLMKLGLSGYLASQLQQPSGFFGSRFIGKMMNKGNAELDQFAFRCADIKASDHLLEIGFGNGQLLQQLCEVVNEGKVFGADISEELINQVSNRLKDHIESKKLKLHLSGVSELPLGNNSIDTVITNNTIYFWPNPLKDAEELFRILKPQGKLVIGFRTANDMKNYPFVTENLHIFKNHYSEKQVQDLLLKAGFSSVNIRMKKGELADSHVAVAVN